MFTIIWNFLFKLLEMFKSFLFHDQIWIIYIYFCSSQSAFQSTCIHVHFQLVYRMCSFNLSSNCSNWVVVVTNSGYNNYSILHCVNGTRLEKLHDWLVILIRPSWKSACIHIFIDWSLSRLKVVLHWLFLQTWLQCGCYLVAHHFFNCIHYTVFSDYYLWVFLMLFFSLLHSIN